MMEMIFWGLNLCHAPWKALHKHCLTCVLQSFDGFGIVIVPVFIGEETEAQKPVKCQHMIKLEFESKPFSLIPQLLLLSIVPSVF